MTSQIAPVRARRRDIDESEQRRPKSRVTREELHPPVLQARERLRPAVAWPAAICRPNSRTRSSTSGTAGEGAAPGAGTGGATVVIAWRRYGF